MNHRIVKTTQFVERVNLWFANWEAEQDNVEIVRASAVPDKSRFTRVVWEAK